MITYIMDPPPSFSSTGIIASHSNPPSPTNANRPSHLPKHHASPNVGRSAKIPSTHVAKVIKGEIHNVLTVMRSDPRYTSTTSTAKRKSIKPNSNNNNATNVDRHRFWTATNSTDSDSISSHLLQGLRDLHDTLSDDHHGHHNHADFVSPFAAVVCSRNANAKTTAAALLALHKFIVYGFVGSENDDTNDDAQSIEVVACCIPRCSRTILNVNGSDTVMTDGKIVSSSSSILLKLLSLSVQVLRCHASRHLSSRDIIGVVETCLDIALAAGPKQCLLRSAAADALSHCVIVVFGRGVTIDINSRRKVVVGESDSDDDWGERDPTEEIINFPGGNVPNRDEGMKSRNDS